MRHLSALLLVLFLGCTDDQPAGAVLAATASESDSASIEPPWEETGSGFRVRPGTRRNDDANAPSNGSNVGQIVFDLGGLPNGTNLHSWARVRATGHGSNSFYVSTGGGFQRVNINPQAGFQWIDLPGTGRASGGTLQLRLKNREAGFEVASVVASDDPNIDPANPPTSPPPVAGGTDQEIEAESVSPPGPWERTASGVAVRRGTPRNDDPAAPSSSQVGVLSYTFDALDASSDTRFWIRYRARDFGSDSLYAAVGGAFSQFTLPVNDAFGWLELSFRGAGSSPTLRIKNREQRVEIDRVVASTDPSFVPGTSMTFDSGPGVDAGPPPVDAAPPVDAGPPPTGGGAYLTLARDYADIVLAQGRDTYGPVRSPLFVDALNVDDYEPYRWPNRIDSPAQQQYPDTWIASDFAGQQNLQAFMRELTSLTGEARYAQAARDAASYMLSSGAHSSGVLYWGHHMAIDLLNDVPVGLAASPGRPGMHEMNVMIPEYEYLSGINNAAVRKNITTFVRSSVLDWEDLIVTRHVGFTADSNVFSRVSRIDTTPSLPVQATTSMTRWSYFIPLIQQGVLFDHIYDDDRAFTLAEEIIERHIAMRNSNGLGPNSYAYLNTPSDYEVATIAEQRFEHMPQLLLYLGELIGKDTTKGRYLIQVATDELLAWSRHIHVSGTETFRLPGGSAEQVLPQLLWALCRGYRLTGNRALWDAARGIIDGYGLGEIGSTPGGSGSATGRYDMRPLKGYERSDRRQRDRSNNKNAYTVHALLELYRATDRAHLLTMAEAAMDQLIDDLLINGLFVRQPDGLYARLADAAPLALLDLVAAQRGRRLGLESVMSRDPYLRVPHGRTSWLNTRDKIWDNEVVFCRRRSTNACP